MPYRTQSPDTDLWTERLLIERWRTMEPSDKAELMSDLYQSVRALSFAGLRSLHPAADEQELRIREACLRLDPELVRRVSGWIPEDLACDRDYVVRWARELGVADLLERALDQSGLGPS
jgi:energy-converting hydrogenase A subunit M